MIKEVDPRFRPARSVDTSARLCSHRQAARDPEVDLIGGLSVQCGMTALGVVEPDVSIDPGTKFWRIFIGSQVLTNPGAFHGKGNLSRL